MAAFLQFFKSCILWLYDIYITYSLNCKKESLLGKRVKQTHKQSIHILTNTCELQNKKLGLDSWFYYQVQMTSVPHFKYLYNRHSATCSTYLCGFPMRLDSRKASKMLCKKKVYGGGDPLWIVTSIPPSTALHSVAGVVKMIIWSMSNCQTIKMQ